MVNGNGKPLKSKLTGFHKLNPAQKLQVVKEFSNLTSEETSLLKKTGALDIDAAGRMIENVIGTTELPLGIATNFLINGRDYLIPMVLEEPSVVAAASNAAKLARPRGGFSASSDDPLMIGQIQLVGVDNIDESKKKIMLNKEKIFDMANKCDSILVKFGGGVRDIEIKDFNTRRGKMLVVHLVVDVRDAMGANAVNTMAERVAPFLEELTGGNVRLRIITNLADRRLARSKAVWDKDVLGEETIERILDAYELAANDQYRCTTHNKGIMNGIDAVVIATANDFRAIEAGAHSYAARNGKYEPLTKYEKDEEGNLVGRIELPLALGLVGGATRTHPIAKIAVKIIGAKSTKELAEVVASVGLAQNFAALRALATEGIQKGHLKLHATNFAVMAGASGDMINKIAKEMIEEGNISYDRASTLLEEFQRSSNSKAASET
ncbi:MAG: hydroxymethylglutaryl-CoA reductase, degradative [Candidatus Aenigmarchaeota archaeon]|nr:hydroxymethylglutaryl-CoA reductase, degradative [Candidatus Aenigmarchaeota archaeon]